MGNAPGKIARCPFDELQRARINTAKSMRCTPGEASEFYFLCKEGKTDEVRQILEDRSSPPIEELNKLQPNGSTPLHAATFYGHLEIVKLLVEHNCPRTTLNSYGKTAYEEALSPEMRELFMRPNSLDRFHETNTTNAIAMFLPQKDIESVNVSKKVDYVQLFQTESEISKYSLNQQTTAMWLNFYNWFFHKFRTFTERDDFNIDAFDLVNHPDFQQFLKQSLKDPAKYENTMKSINEAKKQNSIKPLINLYTNEGTGFYHSFNRFLAQCSHNTGLSEHLCDRFIIEFYIRRQELRQRSFTGTVYRGATIAIDDLNIYRYAMGIDPPGVLGFKAFTSTSQDLFIALNFTLKDTLKDGQIHVIFTFKITESSATIFGVSDASDYSHEQEVLILPGNLFIVENIKKRIRPPITEIHLKHINIPISFTQKIKQTIRSGKKSVL